MTTRAIDDNGDWVFGHSMLDYKEDLEEVKQNILTSLRSWTNDCFFDLEAGVDWKTFLGSFNAEEELKESIINSLKGIKEIVNIEKVETILNGKTRHLIVNLTINTIYGTIDLAEDSNVLN